MGNQQASPQFTDKDAQILAQTSGKSEAEIRQWYNDFHAESGQTGRLNKQQFKNYYGRLSKKPNLDQLTDHIFRAFDLNHSGTIEFSEFLLAYIAATTGSNRQKFEYAFEVYDINDNQFIDKKEAQKIVSLICRIIGIPKDEAEAYTDTVMLSFDSNGDKVLTKSEFIEGCIHDPTLAKISNPFQL